MTGRDTEERHRVSTNLELLFDLTFVVAVSQIARELAHAVSLGEFHAGIQGYAMVFFAIWWAWMNFTWFASAFDTDDVPYRLLTLLQMVGVLVLAAGVPKAFEDGNFDAITVGYLIMRVALVAQWVRAGLAAAEFRATCLRYAAGVMAVQVCWLIRLTLPASWNGWTFLVLALAELCVPPWAERSGHTNWHPEHIAERYGLFTLIVLGECVAQTSMAVQSAFTDHGVSVTLVTTGIAGLVMLFGIWWIYFAAPVDEHLRQRRERSFLWGYGHYLVFGALAAVAAGLEVAVSSGSEHLEISRVAIAFSVAIPLAAFLIGYATMHAYVSNDLSRVPVVALTAALVLLAAVSACAWTTPVTLTLIAVVMIGLVTYKILAADAPEELQAEPASR